MEGGGRRRSFCFFASAVALLLSFIALVGAVPYPIDATWMANRWTRGDWITALTSFRQIGGSIVWQRGVSLRSRTLSDIQQDPDYSACVGIEQCTDKAAAEIKSLGANLVTWFTYSNAEDYLPKAMLKCPHDILISSSRIYYRLIVPHDAYTPEWDCTIKKGMNVDVILTHFAGIDPHKLLVESASKLNMTVYLPQPSIPNDAAQWPAFFEFTRRVMDSYSLAYDGFSAYQTGGVYQNNEACLCMWYESIAKANTVLSAMTHAKGRKFVLSPYIDTNRDTYAAVGVEEHKKGFKVLARSGADVMAIQEGRGVANSGYWYKFQANTNMSEVDPKLYEIVYSKVPNRKNGPTFGQSFVTSIQELFKGFEAAVDELKTEGVNVELWLNLEAFEYLRDAPCLPIDEGNNGMGEMLDRTIKSRLDWALSASAARVSKVISFAWDSCYTCIPDDTQFTRSLAEDIVQDWSRPIVAYLDLRSELVRGFNLMAEGKVTTDFIVTCADGKTTFKLEGIEGDDQWGVKNHRQPLLQQVKLFGLTTKCPATDTHLCVSAVSMQTGQQSYYPTCYESS